jgi:c-di-GMP-binding flagellar brake protein YcgR
MEYIEREHSDDTEVTLTINELLQVQWQDEPTPSTYRCRIDDIVDGKLVASWPTSAGIRMPVHADQMLNFSFVRESNVYAFAGLVDSTAAEPLPQITVIINSEIHRIQRRQNFRIRSLIPIELTGEIRGSSIKDENIPIFLKTTTHNISAGGVSIRSPKGFIEGSILETKIGLPDHEPMIKAPCRVIYSEPAVDNAKLVQTGMQYLTISEKEKARIVRYIYRAQLKSLQD